MAMSFNLFCGLYPGWRTIAATLIIWKGLGSSSIPNFHSPPLTNISSEGNLKEIKVFY